MIPTIQHAILAINAGSSSVKFQLFARTPTLELLAKGEVDDIGGKPSFSATDEKTQRTEKKALPAQSSHETALKLVLDWTGEESGAWQIDAIAHRIVHGGTAFKTSVLITPAVIETLKTFIPFAPLHQPHNLAAIDIITKINPDMPQIACFDTAFHSGHAPLFTTYALAQKWRDKGIRHYGFHGLSYEWIAYALKRDDPALATGRIIAAHLGNGATLCAMHNGVSIDTTTGMTALDGLPMGTRCGNLDPGAVIYMIRDLGLSPDDVEHTLYSESGLFGLSGTSNNVKELQDSHDKNAQFALEYFSLKAAQFMGAMAVALGGVDGIVFTGGIGENSAFVRDKIIARIGFMKPFDVRVIPANEERMMAMHALACLESKA